MNVAPTLLLTIAAQEIAVAVVFALAFRVWPRDRDDGIAALLASVAALHAAGSAASQQSGPIGGVARIATPIGLLLAVALGVIPLLGARRGDRHSFACLALGMASLALTLVFDGCRAIRLVGGPQLADAGLLAIVVSLVVARSLRHASERDALERKRAALEDLVVKTEGANEELAVVQAELAKKEQLAAVGELAAVIAHEVRNPLAIIANAVAGLRKEAISSEDRDTLLSILDEETSRLNRLVSDLLRYARPLNLQRAKLSLNDLLVRTIGYVRTSEKGIDATLRFECDDERLWGDGNLLRQAFDNLVDNAVQAMGGGGTLTIRVHTTTVDGVDGLAVAIIDTGEGMDTNVRSRARDPFFTTRPSGTGLGLAIVDRIVAAHEGHLTIDSHAGEGTTVTVFLPLGSPSEPPSARPARVLVSQGRQDLRAARELG